LTNGSSRELVLDALYGVLDMVQGVVLDAVQHYWIYPRCTYTNVKCLWYNERGYGSTLSKLWPWPWIRYQSNMDGPGALPGVTWKTGALTGWEPNKSCRQMT